MADFANEMRSKSKHLSVSNETFDADAFNYLTKRAEPNTASQCTINDFEENDAFISNTEIAKNVPKAGCNAPIVLMSSICSFNDAVEPRKSETVFTYNQNSHHSQHTFLDFRQASVNKELDETSKQTECGSEFSAATTRSATYFDIAVMRCLLSTKWHSDGYLWALEYLSYRVSAICDFILKEQDTFLKFNSSASVPFNLNELCIQMGQQQQQASSTEYAASEESADSESLFIFDPRSSGLPAAHKASLNHEFIELIEQIRDEDEFTNAKYAKPASFYDYSKRKKYETNFHNRIR